LGLAGHLTEPQGPTETGGQTRQPPPNGHATPRIFKRPRVIPWPPRETQAMAPRNGPHIGALPLSRLGTQGADIQDVVLETRALVCQIRCRGEEIDG